MISFAMEHEGHGSSGPPPDFKKAHRQKSQLVDPAKETRLPPHDLPAELAVLGSILLSPKDALGLCIEKLPSSEVFYSLPNRTIYETLLTMFADNVPVDILTLRSELADLCQLEAVGGLSFLASLPDAVPAASNIDYYLTILLEKFTLRKLISLGTDIVSKSYDHQGEVDELVESFERDAISITKDRVTVSTPPFKELIGQAITYIEGRHQKQGQIGGLSTGFVDLDKLCDGFHAGEFIIIAGRPGTGKTSIGMNIAEHVALELKLPVGIFSMEMTGASLALRMMSSVARVNTRNIQDGFLSERDFTRLTLASGRLHKASLFIDDESSLSVMRLRAKARRMHQQHGIKLLVIDYLQLMTSPGGKKENRQQEVTEISHGVKSLAKELVIPVLSLAQLNRDAEREKGRRPRLSDLRESGSLEADADLVGLLYKPKSDDDKPEEDAVPTTLIIAKQRSGPVGDVNLVFLKSVTRFESAGKISAEDHSTPYVD